MSDLQDFYDKYWAFTNEPSKYKWDDVKPFLAELVSSLVCTCSSF